jgi:hypothetical protein
MPISFLGPYTRSILTAAIIVFGYLFYYSGIRADLYVSAEALFIWSETTWFGVIGKTWGAAFAFVEAVHLLGLAVLGGCVIASDGRLLGLMLTDFPARMVVDRSHRVFVWALITCLVTGIFMACGVATKIYFLQVYWFKMLALVAGMLFHFFIRMPLLRHDLDEINPVVVKLVAISSILVWFTVAATGRWIGFSG